LRAHMLEAVATLAEMSYAVIGEVAGSRGQERVRYDCMRALLKLAGRNAAEVVIETRERALRNVGQNRTDHRAIVDARHAGGSLRCCVTGGPTSATRWCGHPMRLPA
jgi:hypothetical protein